MISSGTTQSARQNIRYTWEYRREGCERQGQSWKQLGVAATSLEASRLTVEWSGKNNIFFGNAAGSPGNHSYCLSFNDF